jgi:hypothetical protein
MSEMNIAVVRRFVDDLKNGANPQAAPEIVNMEKFTHHFNFPGLPEGFAGFGAIAEVIMGAFPDLRVEVEFLVDGGEYVVERSVVTATHKGDFMGVPATGNPVRWTENNIYRVKDSKIVEVWPEGDVAGILAQIGAMQKG